MLCILPSRKGVVKLKTGHDGALTKINNNPHNSTINQHNAPP